MIDRKALLSDLQKQVKAIEASLRERLDEEKKLQQRVRAEYDRAFGAKRTGDSYPDWLEERLAQVASSWVLACVFVRFLEDNELVETPRIAGLGERLERARDEETLYFRQNSSHSHREYLESIFRETAKLPTMDRLLGEGHNPLWTLGPTADGVKALLDTFRERRAASGGLTHDFTDPTLNTRFLGDLYQDLSKYARKRYALLQTPDFVEDFILDNTLTPAISEFGLKTVTVIDPACGSGHFLIGVFHRLLRKWQQTQPGIDVAVHVQSVFNAMAGVDINPFAIAIARFRLIVLALTSCAIRRLREAPGFRVRLAVGDSLLHGPRPNDVGSRNRYLNGFDPLSHVYDVEDVEDLRSLLGARYSVAIANPPYIRPIDAALSEAYRARFTTCHRKYQLGVPFIERCFDLASTTASGDVGAGFVGIITAQSFAKSAFGKLLVTRFLASRDLTHIVDVSGVRLPGHGTPTIILFARAREPVASTVRAIRGIRGDPPGQQSPGEGPVWMSILSLFARPGETNSFLSVDDVPRAIFAKHPWSVGGGGAAELKEHLESLAACRVKSLATCVGFGAILGEDDAFGAPVGSPRFRRVPDQFKRALVEGEHVRDWSCDSAMTVLFPYTSAMAITDNPAIHRVLWPLRTTLWARPDFSKQTFRECGRPYWEYHQMPAERSLTPLSIAFAFKESGNHFALDRGGKVFNRTAPIIKLPPDASVADHLGLVGLLNSSTATFWMKQVCRNTGGPGGGASKGEKFNDYFERDGGRVGDCPVPPHRSVLSDIASALDREALLLRARSEFDPAQSSQSDIAALGREVAASQCRLISYQEEMDWTVYGLFGLVSAELLCSGLASVPDVQLGERPFEVALARQVAAEATETEWFSRCGASATTQIPSRWAVDYRALVARRLECIANDQQIGLLESPENKRQWRFESWPEIVSRQCRAWLIRRLEDARFWPQDTAKAQSCARLADAAQRDVDFRRVAALFRGGDDVDVAGLVTELVMANAVPVQSASRFTDTGLRTHCEWKLTWEAQRKEDRGEPQGGAANGPAGNSVTPPSRFSAPDFRSPVFAKHRGKLDVANERFVLLSCAERDQDGTPVVVWAGYDHLQQAQAIASYYLERKEHDGWSKARLIPILVGVYELVPWLLQWHNAPDPDYGMGLGTYYKGVFIEEELRCWGLTTTDLDNWRPPERAGHRSASTPREKTLAVIAAADTGSGTTPKAVRPPRKRTRAAPRAAGETVTMPEPAPKRRRAPKKKAE